MNAKMETFQFLGANKFCAFFSLLIIVTLLACPGKTWAGTKDDADAIISNFDIKSHIDKTLAYFTSNASARDKASKAINMENINDQLRAGLEKYYTPDELLELRRISSTVTGRSVLNKQPVWSNILMQTLMTEMLRANNASPGIFDFSNKENKIKTDVLPGKKP